MLNLFGSFHYSRRREGFVKGFSRTFYMMTNRGTGTQPPG